MVVGRRFRGSGQHTGVRRQPAGSSTNLFYVKNSVGEPLLARVVYPGGATYDLGYQNVSMGRYTRPMINAARDPLVNGLIAAGLGGVTTGNGEEIPRECVVGGAVQRVRVELDRLRRPQKHDGYQRCGW